MEYGCLRCLIHTKINPVSGNCFNIQINYHCGAYKWHSHETVRGRNLSTAKGQEARTAHNPFRCLYIIRLIQKHLLLLRDIYRSLGMDNSPLDNVHRCCPPCTSTSWVRYWLPRLRRFLNDNKILFSSSY